MTITIMTMTMGTPTVVVAEGVGTPTVVVAEGVGDKPHIRLNKKKG
jgi:hypothetical protein